MIYLTIVVCITYFLLVLWLIIGFEKCAYYEAKETAKSELFVSIIIPVRNEAKNILNLIEDLSKQNYPSSLIEVLIVDDFSSDGTYEIVKKAIGKVSFSLELIQLPQEFKNSSNKKKAIEASILKSKGDLIITTDGDCRVGPNWIKSIVQFKNENNSKFISGPVAISSSGKEGFWTQLQRIEFSSLIGSGAACINWGLPTMCNGANIAYEKSLFLEVNGFKGNELIPSGDDEFLMHKVHARYPSGVHFLKTNDALVTTEPQSDLKSFLNQRTRWAGKWSHYQTKFPKILALFVFIFNICLLSNFVLAMAGLLPITLFLEQLILKIFAEFVFLSKVNDLNRKKIPLHIFLLLELIYPIYVIGVALLGLRGQYSWKGRIVK